MKILQTNTFLRAAKRLHRNQISALKKAVEAIQNDPAIGELKKGDLAGVRVYKFRILHQLILLAYWYEENTKTLTLLSFAPHENFYDALKNQIKSSF
jgi:mRNA-degrading endonuclease RelE of RelBE toxin-antitoxin system